MTNSLDSRFLRLGDCFGQRFPTPGQVRCFIAPSAVVPAATVNRREDLLIDVTPKTAPATAGPKQVDVAVKPDGQGGLTIDSQHISIEAGDGVLFYTADRSGGGFAVSGVGTNFHFDSSRIQNNGVYTHVFGAPGRYEWSDAHEAKVSGVVEVRQVEAQSAEDRSAWLETLKKPAVFEIRGGQCSPAAVEIVAGQTVFWSITDSPGIAIVDRQLMATLRLRPE